MDTKIDRRAFRTMFADKSIELKDLRPGGQSRRLAEEANHAAGRGDSAIYARDEYHALFDILDRKIDTDGIEGELTLRNQDGSYTDVGVQVERFLRAARGKRDLFNADMYMIHVTGWPADKMKTVDNVDAPRGATFALWETDPSSNLHIAPPEADGVVFATSDFSMRNSGNFTLHAPKESWKVRLEGERELLNMDRVNLKSMFNDPSQMREAIVWELFDKVGVPSPKHTFAKLAINHEYQGLYSMIEQIDKQFLQDHFGDNDEGNLFKAYWEDIGPANLAHRRDAQGEDDGDAYFRASSIDDRTYQLKTNDDDPERNSYDDLATFIRTVNGAGIAGGDEKFNTDEYRDAVQGVMNAKGFLRWAAMNLLVGGWDNYFATPSNYYLYNSGKKGDEDGFMESPYFNWIPWDYDNALGNDFFDTKWQYTDILDWGSNTRKYNKDGTETDLPLLENLLKNDDFKQYYLDALEWMLDTHFNPEAIGKTIGAEGSDGLWDRVRSAAYLESDSEHGPAFTGRQFTNHEVYLQGQAHWELHRGQQHVEGIPHYVRMRYDSAKQQLANLRQQYPKGASGADFSSAEDALPEA